jgi:mono/diheme cytochrome c family protein
MESLRALATKGFAALAVAVMASGAALAADAANGERIAARWCNSCHVATGGQTTGQDVAPPFTRIARDVTLTPERVRDALAGRHPRMPDLSLTREEMADLSAYIFTLRR